MAHLRKVSLLVDANDLTAFCLASEPVISCHPSRALPPLPLTFLPTSQIISIRAKCRPEDRDALADFDLTEAEAVLAASRRYVAHEFGLAVRRLEHSGLLLQFR